LEADVDLTVGNARHIKNVPGRKTDIKDADWIAEHGTLASHALRHGLIRKSFVPPPPLRDLRELLRYRRTLVEARAAERNRVIKLLESAGTKLAHVVSDVFGVSGMAILQALIDGQTAPMEMAQLAKGRLRPKRSALAAALEGPLTEHHRFLLRVQLRRLDGLDQDIAALDQRVAEKLQSYATALAQLITIPGVDVVAAATIIAEIG